MTGGAAYRKSGNVQWEITVMSDGVADVTVALPDTGD